MGVDTIFQAAFAPDIPLVNSLRPSPANSKPNSECVRPSAAKHWAIVGGGLMGIRLALSLRELGQRVTIFEASNELGGLASSWELNGIRWDRHYHVISMTDSRLLQFLNELGLDDQIDWVETRTGFYSGGQLYSMSNAFEFLRFPPLNLIEKLRLGSTIFAASKIRNSDRLESIPVDEWLKRWSGQGTFNKIWKPLLRAKLGDNHDKVSAAFIWATIQRMYKARRTGIKKEMFGCVRGGYETILQRAKSVIEDKGIELRLNAPVKQVIEADHKIQVNSNEERQGFDRALLTVPATLVPKICPQLSAKESEACNAVEYQGIVCASALLRKSLSPYYVTNITDDWVPLTGIIEMTRIVDPALFKGNHLVYLPKYVPQENQWMQKTDESIREEFQHTLLKMYPKLQMSDFVDFKVSRVKNVMALPILNYSKKVPPIRLSIPGIFTVNSAHITQGVLNVNETIELAETALREHLIPSIEAATTGTQSLEPNPVS